MPNPYKHLCTCVSSCLHGMFFSVNIEHKHGKRYTKINIVEDCQWHSFCGNQPPQMKQQPHSFSEKRKTSLFKGIGWINVYVCAEITKSVLEVLLAKLKRQLPELSGKRHICNTSDQCVQQKSLSDELLSRLAFTLLSCRHILLLIFNDSWVDKYFCLWQPDKLKLIMKQTHEWLKPQVLLYFYF